MGHRYRFTSCHDYSCIKRTEVLNNDDSCIKTTEVLKNLMLNHEERIARLEAQIRSLYQSMSSMQMQLNLLQEQVGAILQPLNSLRDQLLAMLNQTVSIETNAGSVSGLLYFVGNDFVQIIEISGDTVLIPLCSVVAF